MIGLVSMDWVAAHLGHRDVTIVDARRPMKYLSGHLPGAVNVPTYKSFGPDGRLLDPQSMAALMGDLGLGSDSTAVIYDSPEGQNAAMLAWILDYLGHPEIRVLDGFFETWKTAGREVLYKPVATARKSFIVQLRPAIRADLEWVSRPHGQRFVDCRSPEEYRGATAVGRDRAGHIPGAVNISWRELGLPPERLLKPAPDLVRLTDAVGIRPGDTVVVYCRSGPRAALGYLALSQLGISVRLFDGSFAQWSQSELPVET
jgi:thiosulfate/3-mercaptopyruvate sulfurtransferase